jgi:polar amino acid transport system permease protein
MDEILQNFFDRDALRESWSLLELGIKSTVTLAVVAFAVALGVGVLVAAGRLQRLSAIRGLTIVFTDVVRATPPLVSLTIVYYVLPAFGLPSLSVFQAAVLTFALLHGAYVGEIYRSGWISLEKGQREAALALGLSPLQTGRLVLVPQLMRVIIPPLTSQLTQVFRDTPLVFIIGYSDLLTRARQAMSLTSNATPLIATAFIYLVILLVLQGLSLWVERRSEGRMSAAASKERRRWRRPAAVGAVLSEEPVVKEGS